MIGGKAYNLQRLSRLQIPIAPGFCITTNVYIDFMSSHNLLDGLAESLCDLNPYDTAEMERQVQIFREMLISQPLAPDLMAVIAHAYAELATDSVAVRSSAVAEDLSEASFAGQYESFLNVRDLDTIFTNVKLCWASLWSTRAILYRARKHIGINADMKMAVIVQAMIHSKASGVLFTRNPFTGANEAYINGSWGLGEAIVQGEVTPDTFIVEKNTYRVRQRVIADKKVMATAACDRAGMTIVDVSEEDRRSSTLVDEEVVQLARYSAAIEDGFGAPQDIEWAYDGRGMWITQARPISVDHHQRLNRQNKGLKRTVLKFLLDYFPTPPYPFDRSVTLSLVDATLDLVKKFGLVPPLAREILYEENNGVLGLKPLLPRMTWLTPLKAFPGLLLLVRSLRINPARWQAETLDNLLAEIENLREVEIEQVSDAALLVLIRRCITFRDEIVLKSRFDYLLGGWVVAFSLRALLKVVAHSDAESLYASLMGGLDHPSSQMIRQLHRLACSVQGSEAIRRALTAESGQVKAELQATPEGRLFLADAIEVLNRIGTRSASTLPSPSSATLKDDPEGFLRLIGRMAESGEGQEARSSSDSFQAALVKVRERLRKVGLLWIGFGRIVQFLVDRTRAMNIERDWVVNLYDLLTEPMHDALMELGERAAVRQLLERKADIRFLGLDEVEELFRPDVSGSAGHTKDKVVWRKFARIESQLHWKSAMVQRLRRGNVLLTGFAASRGVCSGPARIVRSERDFAAFRTSDILVAPTTSASWTPLLWMAAGVVTDTGGPLSHAAIVAREFGIPAVLNTEHATMVMVGNSSYTVDGNRGEVLKN